MMKGSVGGMLLESENNSVLQTQCVQENAFKCLWLNVYSRYRERVCGPV